MTAEEMNVQLPQQIQSLNDTIASLNHTLDAQTVLIAQLNQTIQELKEQPVSPRDIMSLMQLLQ